jgi:hypothetical protein
VVCACVAFGLVQAGQGQTATRVVLVSECGQIGVQRPKEIVFTCADAGFRIEHLRWSSWGGKVAVARGTQMQNTCDPFCAAGNFRITAVTLRLFKRRVCPGRSHLYYLDGAIVEPSGKRTSVGLFCPS